MELIKLNNGELVNKSEIKVAQIQSELPRFLKIAVGHDRESKWYVQTSDFFNETMLSDSIKEGMESFSEADELAQNISRLTGLEIEYWNVDVDVEKMLKGHNFYNKLDINMELDDCDSNPSSTARIYGVFPQLNFDGKTILKSYFSKDEVEKFLDVYECHRGEKHSMYEFIVYFRGLTVTEIYKALKKLERMKELISATYDYSVAVERMEEYEKKFLENKGEEDKKQFIELLKAKGFDYDNGNNSTYDNGSYAVYEALQGYDNDKSYSMDDVYEYSDEGRFSAEYTSVVESVSEETNCILLRHDFEMLPTLQENVDKLEEILSDKEQSEYNLYLDSEKAWDKYERFIANPILSNDDIKELDNIGEESYQLSSRVEDLHYNYPNSPHSEKLLSLAKKLESIYDEVNELVSAIKKQKNK